MAKINTYPEKTSLANISDNDFIQLSKAAPDSTDPKGYYRIRVELAKQLLGMTGLPVGSAVGDLWATSDTLPTALTVDDAISIAWTLSSDVPSGSRGGSSGELYVQSQLKPPEDSIDGVWVAAEVGGVEHARIKLPWRGEIEGETVRLLQVSSTGAAIKVVFFSNIADGDTHFLFRAATDTLPANTVIKVYASVVRGQRGLPGQGIGGGLTQDEVDARIRALTNAIALIGDTDRWPLDKVTQAQIGDFFQNVYIFNELQLNGVTLNSSNLIYSSPVLSPTLLSQSLYTFEEWGIRCDTGLVSTAVTNTAEMRAEFIFTSHDANLFPPITITRTINFPFTDSVETIAFDLKEENSNLVNYGNFQLRLTWLSGADISFVDGISSGATNVGFYLVPVGESSGGLTTVATDDTLSGDGTPTDPLSVVVRDMRQDFTATVASDNFGETTDDIYARFVGANTSFYLRKSLVDSRTGQSVQPDTIKLYFDGPSTFSNTADFIELNNGYYVYRKNLAIRPAGTFSYNFDLNNDDNDQLWLGVSSGLDYSTAEADISKSLKFLVEQRDIDFSVGQKTIDWEDDTVIAGGNVVLMQGIDGDIVNAGYTETPPETNYLLRYKGRDIPFKLALFTSNDHISLFTSVSDPELPSNLAITFNGNAHTRDSHTNTDEIRRYRFVPQTAITVGDDFTLNITGTDVEFGTLEHTNPVNRTIIDEELIKKVKSKIVVVSNDDGSIRPATADDYHNKALAIIGQNLRIATKIPVSTVNVTYEDNFDPWADDAGVTYRGVYNNYYDRNNAAARDGVYSKNQHGFYVYTAADGWTFPRPQPANVRGNYANETEADNHITANGQVAEWGNELHKVTAYTAGVVDGYVWGQLQDIQTLIDSLQAVETGLEGAQTSISNLTTQVEELSNPAASDVSVDTSSFENNLQGSDNTVQKALNRLDSVEISGGEGGEGSVTSYVQGEILGVIDDALELGGNQHWVGTGVTIPEGVHWLAVDLGLAHDGFELIDWDLVLAKDAAVIGEASVAGDFETTILFSTTNRIIRIGHTANNEITFAVHSGQTISIPSGVMVEALFVSTAGGSFDIDGLSTDVLADNSEFGFNKKTPIRQHLLYSENQEVSFQRDGATEIYDVNLPPPDAPRREGAEWGSADSKISDALWSGRFSDGFLSLDLRSAGLADPQTLAWRAVGSVGENTASFVNPVGFDRADVNFFTDHLSSPQSWRRHFFIDIVQEASSFPLVPAFLLVGTGVREDAVITAGVSGNTRFNRSASGFVTGAAVGSAENSAGDIEEISDDNRVFITFVESSKSKFGTPAPSGFHATNLFFEKVVIQINNGTEQEFYPSNHINEVVGQSYVYLWQDAAFTNPLNIGELNIGVGDTIKLNFKKADGSFLFQTTTSERIPLIANDPSGHNTQESLWWSEDPAASSFTVAELNEKTFDVEFTNGYVLYHKPAPATLFTSTDISTLNNLALVTLDKINRVNTNRGGGTFYLQGHKRVHNGADYLRLTLFNDEALTDQASRDDINPTFAHSTETSVSFNFRLADFPATNEIKKTALSDLARQIAKFSTPRDAQLQQEINDLRQVTANLSVTGRPTIDTEPVLGSLHLTAERPDAGERSGGFEAGQQTVLGSETTEFGSWTILTSAGAIDDGISGAISVFQDAGVAFQESSYELSLNGVSIPFWLILYNVAQGPDLRVPRGTVFPANLQIVLNGTSYDLTSPTPTQEGAGDDKYNFATTPATAGDDDFTLDITGTGIEFGKDEPVVITGPEFLDYTDTVRSGSNSHKFLIIERPFDEDKNDLELLLTADGVTFPDLIGDGRNFVEIPSTSVANRYYYYQLLDAFQEQGVISIQRRTASYAETLYTGKTRSNRGPTLPAASADWLPGELFSLLNPNGPFTGETDVTFTQIAANIIGVQNPFSGSDVYRIAFTELTKGGWIQTDGVDSEEVNSWTHLILGNEAYALTPGVLTVDGNTLKQVIGADGNLLTGQDSPFNDIDVGDTVRASVRKRDGSYVGGATPTFEIAHYERQDTTSTDLEDVWHPQALVHPDHEEILQVLSNHFRKDRDIHDAKLFLNHTRGWSDGLSGLDNVPDDFPSAIHSITWHNDISDTNRYRRFVIEVTEAASARSYHEKTFVYRGTEHELLYYTRSGNNNRYRTAAGSQTSDPGSPWRRLNLENVSYEVHEVFTGSRAWLFHKGE